jgi:hypothetical protein
MIEIVDKPTLQARDIRDGFVALASGVVELDQQIIELVAAVGRKPESFDEVKAEIASLRSSVKAMVQAIQAIKLPDVHIPEPKEVEKPEPVDLSPLVSELADIKRIISSPNVVETATETAKVKKWTFEVKRNQAGYIKTVEATSE